MEDIVPASRRRCDYVVAVDIGGTKILVCLFDARDRVVAERRISTEQQLGPQVVVERLVGAVKVTLQESRVELSQVLGVGISSAGPSNPTKGIVFNSPNLFGWRDVPLVEWVEDGLGLKACLGNDATLAALAEYVYGAGGGIANMIYITVSTGIGGGIVANGQVYWGGMGTAGEIGHNVLRVDGPQCSCGRRGCLESYSAGWALAQKGRELAESGRSPLLMNLASGDPSRISAETLFQADELGDSSAKAIIDEGSQYLGVALANLSVLLDPEMIVIGGGLANRWERYVQPAADCVHATKYPIPLDYIRIVPAKLGSEVSAWGALALARQTFGVARRRS
jgi:glucokinase